MSSQDDRSRTSRSLNLTTGGLTLLGVLVGIGVTVSFGVKAGWWVRLLAGVATTARLANWIIGGGSPGAR